MTFHNFPGSICTLNMTDVIVHTARVFMYTPTARNNYNCVTTLQRNYCKQSNCHVKLTVI